MINKTFVKGIAGFILDMYSSTIKNENSYLVEGIQEALADRNLSVVPNTDDIVDNFKSVAIEAATRFETTNGVLDETALAADTAAINDFAPILKDAINWCKTYIGSNPSGTGPGDDE